MFDIVPGDIDKVIESVIVSNHPIQINRFPKKEKQKYIVLCMICHLFEKDKLYTEHEVNEILEVVYEDFVILRRYLIDYHFLDRKPNGSAYWLTADLNDFVQYKLK
jgi:hypothetical protein